MGHLTLITVDDEAHIHAGLDAIIDWDALGYRHVGSALHGAQALELVTAAMPDVVLTDIRMPGMDGLELIRRIRELTDYSPAIIVISGYDEFDYARTALRYQVEDYLVKPIEEDELCARLTRIRDQRLTARSRPRDADIADAHATAAGSGDASAADAVRRLMTGDRAPGLAPLAAIALKPAADVSLVLAIAAPADSTIAALRYPLSVTRLRAALAHGKARESAEWLMSDPSGGVAFVLRIAREDLRGEPVELWLKGLHHSIAEELGRPIVLVGGPTLETVDDIAGARARIVGCLARRHLVRGPGTLRVDDHEEAVTRPGPGSGPVPSLDPLLDAIERLDGEESAAEAGRVFGAIAQYGVSSDSLRDWVGRFRMQIDALSQEIAGRRVDLPHEPDVRFVEANAEFVPLSVAAASIEAFAVAAVAVLRELRRENRHSVVALMKRRVARRYAENLSISLFAAEYRMSSVYLGRLFRQVEGTGFRDYLRAWRIRQARRLLRDTDFLVPEIAVAVGYHDVDFFTDQFKRETGDTPHSFRTSPGDV